MVMNKYKIGEIVLITTSKNLQELGIPAVFKAKILEFIEANIVSIEAKEFFPVGHAIVGLETFVCGKCATKLGSNKMDKQSRNRYHLMILYVQLNF